MLRLQPDADSDALISTALAAAVNYGVRRMGRDTSVTPPAYWYPTESTDVPDDAHEAALMHAARLYRRRDSIDGTIGFGDVGMMRVGRVDADVEWLYSGVAPIVFG